MWLYRISYTFYIQKQRKIVNLAQYDRRITTRKKQILTSGFGSEKSGYKLQQFQLNFPA